jgi:hypothetical protein
MGGGSWFKIKSFECKSCEPVALLKRVSFLQTIKIKNLSKWACRTWGYRLKHRLKQATNYTYRQMLTFKLLECQPELVEGGFMLVDQLRQAQLYTPIVSNFCHL